MLLKMDIHERLRRLMEQHKWTEYKLAKECGLSESTIANIFRRGTMPSIATLEVICNGFGISLAQFFAEEEMVELTPELKDLFNHWVSLTTEQKEAVYTVVRAFHHSG